MKTIIILKDNSDISKSLSKLFDYVDNHSKYKPCITYYANTSRIDNDVWAHWKESCKEDDYDVYMLALDITDYYNQDTGDWSDEMNQKLTEWEDLGDIIVVTAHYLENDFTFDVNEITDFIND